MLGDLSTAISVSLTPLSLDGTVDVPMDAICPEALESAVAFEDGPDRCLDPGKPKCDASLFAQANDVIQLGRPL